MDSALQDRQAAQAQLQQGGWIARRSEAFHHLPPPALAQWLGADEATPDNIAPTTPTAPEWQLHIDSGSADAVQVQWLSALNARDRAALLAALPAPGAGPAKAQEAAPFAWAHRALCRQGLHLRIAAPASADAPPVVITLRHQPHSAVSAPALIVELAPGARCLLREEHAGSGTHNLHSHIRLGAGAQLQHLRLATPGSGAQWAHHVHATLAAQAEYAQALVASDSAYHLQRHSVQLQGRGAQARQGALLLLDAQQIDQQTHTDLQAAHSHSAVRSLVLAHSGARAVSNAYTRIAPGADEAQVLQRLTGIPLDGAPRLILRPHLEILHDQVQAAHGATWGALPPDALFYARQRGLAEAEARALITQGMARAVLEATLPGSDWLGQWLDTGWLAQRLATHAQGGSGSTA
ncbi:SufBD protein [Acidovorax sp. HDW3]|uniref:SufD family Fe-S cluster assembly protein n=1 Tax=Acidovorax sp. HDW3 TaxID=2714923 RepID=UPI001408CC60|nr:SufD family Fe-S cluster assembly protein [Acidovorax sp. HDW3]QIL43314.1 SufBD protein [Acidovorax sp. HDW3]